MDDKKDIEDDAIREFIKYSSKNKEFKVPDGYFDGFQKNIHARIYNNPKSNLWNLPQFRWFATGFACIAVTLILVFDFNKNLPLAQSELSQEELLAYFSENIDEISETELLDVVTEQDIGGIVLNDTTKTIPRKKEEDTEKPPSLEDFTDEEIFEYMLDEGYGTGEWDNL